MSQEASPGSSAKTEEEGGIETDAEEADEDDQRTEGSLCQPNPTNPSRDTFQVTLQSLSSHMCSRR